MIYMKLVKYLFYILMLLGVTGVWAQKSDIRLGKLLNNGDWFTLEEEYPMIKDSVQTPMLRLMSEALLGYYFNRPDETITCVDSLLQHYQAELGLGNIASMLLVKSIVEANRGNYAVAADILKDFTSQLREQGVAMDYTQIDEAVQFYDRFRNCPPMSIELPQKNTVIAMSNDSIRLNIKNDTVQRGTSMYVSITVNSKQYKAIFDTGASTTFMSEAFAKKTGVRLIADSLQIHGGITVYGQSGILDSIQIGDIMVRNIPITINKDTTLNKVEDIDFLIGADVMALLGEIQIFPHNGKIVIPTLLTEKPASGSNIYMDNRSLILKGESCGKSYNFFFDTGNGLAALSHNFYESNKTEIDAKSKRVRRLTGGIGVVEERDMLILPEWSFQFGGRNVVLKNIAVGLENNRLVPYAGNIGMALINQFDKVTINFDKCFVIFE